MATPRVKGGHLPSVPPLLTPIDPPAGHPGANTNVGVAFDGTELYVTGGNNTIPVFSPAGVETREITATRRYGTLAYDGTRDQLWSCYVNTPRTIERIDKTTGAVQQTIDVSVVGTHFTFCDGLAYDGGSAADSSDDRLYYSPYISSTIFRRDTAGNLIDSFPFSAINTDISTCGNSGLAVGGPDIWLADNCCEHIYRASKPPTAQLDLFNSAGGTRPEDMECDDVTFAPAFAIWVRTFENNTLRACEAPNPCGRGGLPPPPPPHEGPEFGQPAPSY